MLQISTIQPSTLELLIRLRKIELLKATRLIGGTALALLLGHRLSIDLDLFGHVEGDSNTILQMQKVILCPKCLFQRIGKV